jgi:xanthine dehydrogenase accessory factor
MVGADGGRTVVLVRGIGDVGSAVAHRLFRAGHAVMLQDGPLPTGTRRGMAFTDAVFDGVALLEGVEGIRVDDLSTLPAMLTARRAIPVLVLDVSPVLRAVPADVLVDARMRKRIRAESQRGLAGLTIGVGPNFVAGETADLIVETSWGDQLGQVLTRGATRPLSGEPRLLAGHGRDRYVYAPCEGTFRTTRSIGDAVGAGDVVAHIGTTPLGAPLDGRLRGLTHDGVPVIIGTKVIEVDPRRDAAVVRGIGERPARIAEGVLHAMQAWMTRTTA